MSTNTNGLSKRPQVILGEAVDPADFANQSLWGRAYVNDMVLSAAMRLNPRTTNPVGAFGTSWCPPLFSVGDSGAPLNGSSLSRQYTCNEGPLFYTGTLANSGAIDGTTPKVLHYYLQAGEITGQFAAADPTHPRFDAIYIRISEVDGPLSTRNFMDATGFKSGQSVSVDRRTKLEWTIVQGTAATIPVIGAPPDSTWALWGAWWIPATFSTLFALGNIYDFRYPIGYRRHVVAGASIATPAVGGWTYTALSQEWASPSSSAGLYAWCPVHSGRVLGMNWAFRDQPGTSNDVYLLIHGRGVDGSGATGQAVPAGGPGEPNFNMLSSEMTKWTLRGGLWTHVSTVNYPNSALSPTNHYQLLPLWANGFGSTAADLNQQGGGQGAPDGTSILGSEQRRVQAQVFSAATGYTVASCIFDIGGGF